MVNENHKRFVEAMLSSSEKKFDKAAPNLSNADVKEVESLTREIQRRIQQG